MPRIEGLSWNESTEDEIAAHGVTLDEVWEAVQNRRHTRKNRGYLLVLGQTDAGRYLLVVFDDEGDGNWYIVTSRPATPSEKKLLKRQPTARGSTI